MPSPLVCWVIVGGLIIVGVAHTNWQACAVEDPLLLLPMEAAWNVCGSVADPRSPSAEQPILMRWLTGVEHTDGQAGLVARLVLGPLSVQSVCVCLCPPGEQGEGGGWRCRKAASRKLRGCRGCGHRVWMAEGLLCPDGGCNVWLLNRCFRGLCLSRGRDVAGEGQSWEYKRGHLLWGHLTHVPKS